MKRLGSWAGMLLAGAVLWGCTSGLPVVGGRSDGGMDVRCAEPEALCGGRCIDTQTDPDNCGACGTRCARIEACVAGRCALQCPTGQIGRAHG